MEHPGSTSCCPDYRVPHNRKAKTEKAMSEIPEHRFLPLQIVSFRIRLIGAGPSIQRVAVSVIFSADVLICFTTP
jgi:hypothetical protein